MKESDNRLEIKNGVIGYSGKSIIATNISCCFSAGLTGIIGLNGSGKSTLIRTFAGLMPLLEGNIYFNEFSLTEKNVSAIRSRYISVVLTEKPLLPYFTVFDVVAMGRSPYTNVLAQLTVLDIEIINEAIITCGISPLRDKFFNELSDGERQKCMIARALAQNTPVILLDEPTTFLDFRSRAEMMILLEKLAVSQNKIILFSSHELNSVFHFASQCLVFKLDGHIELVRKQDFSQSKAINELLYNLPSDQQHLFSGNYTNVNLHGSSA